MIKTVVTNNKTYDVKESEYEYDKVGNKVKESINDEVTTNTYNKLNQIVASKTANDEETVSNRQFTYDNNGNQIKAVDDVKGTDLTYTYDADNRISKVSGTSEKKAVSQENLYNGDGKRIKKIEEDGEINYFYQNDSVLGTSDKEDKLTSFNIYGDGANVILTMRNTVSGGREYYTYNKDVRGSTSSIIDSQGNAKAIYYYDDFGNTTAKGNFQNEICYTGGIYDETTGLYYLNARYYNPEDGNFMSQDTYRGEYTNPATLNYYGYCNGNPINYVDPSGHDAVFLKSNFVNSYIGHLGLAVQASNKKWRYFTWDTRGWHNEILYMDVSDAIKKGKVYAGINALTMRFTKKLIYTDYIYIKGDFSRSSSYIKKYKKNNKRKGTEYGLTSKNCAWMAIEIFSKGRLSAKKRGQLEKMQWKYNYVPFKKQYIKQRKTIIPNVAMKQLAKIFSVSSRKVRTKR